MIKEIDLLAISTIILIGGILLCQRSSIRKYKSLYEQSLVEIERQEFNAESLEEDIKESRQCIQSLSNEIDTLRATIMVLKGNKNK